MLMQRKTEQQQRSVLLNIIYVFLFIFGSFTLAKLWLFLILTSNVFFTYITWSPLLLNLSTFHIYRDTLIATFGAILHYFWFTYLYNMHAIFRNTSVSTTWSILRSRRFIPIAFLLMPILAWIFGVLIFSPLIQWLLYEMNWLSDSQDNAFFVNFIRISSFIIMLSLLIIDLTVIASKLAEARIRQTTASPMINAETNPQVRTELGSDERRVML
eukprot:gb/GECH01006717.1/.p1 GENE.gb/GECH01006717.1/~~gb/GECH01006717.1/.p1  ORF type:complete len:214 (+),score=19.05 gb/GECH01006717.1/:1-642(+)